MAKLMHIFGRKKGPPTPPKPDYSGSPTQGDKLDDDGDEYSYHDPEKWSNTDISVRLSMTSADANCSASEPSAAGKVYTLSGTDHWVEGQPTPGSPCSEDGFVVGSPVVTEDYSDPSDAKIGDIPTSPSSAERYLYTEPYNEEDQDEELQMYDEPYESVEAVDQEHVIEQQQADMERLRMSAPVDDRPLEEYDDPWEWKNKKLQEKLQQSQTHVSIPGQGQVVVIEDELETDSSDEDIKTLPGYVNIGIKENVSTKNHEHLYVNIHGDPNRGKLSEDDVLVPSHNEFSANFRDSIKKNVVITEEPGNYEDPWDLMQKQEELQNKIRQAQKGKHSQTEQGQPVPGQSVQGLSVPGLSIPSRMVKPSEKPEEKKSEQHPSPARRSQVEGVSSKSFSYHQQDEGVYKTPRSNEVSQKPEVKLRSQPRRKHPESAPAAESQSNKYSSKADDFRPQEEYESPWDLRAKKLQQMSSGSFDHSLTRDHQTPVPKPRPESTPVHSMKKRPTPFALGCSAQNAVGERVDPSIPLQEQSWYHGAITRGDAEALLRVHREGSYLVRQSESNKNDFSLSLKGVAGFIHMKVLHRDNRYILGQASQPFDTISQMIHHYTINKLNIKGADHMLLLHPIIYEML